MYPGGGSGCGGLNGPELEVRSPLTLGDPLECQVGVKWIRIGDGTRIQDPCLIPKPAVFLERGEHTGGIHLRKQCRAGTSIAVFSGQGASVADHKFGGGLSDLAEHAAAFFSAQVVSDADVHASRPKVSVHDPGQLILVQERPEIGQVGCKVLRGNGGVLPAGQ